MLFHLKFQQTSLFVVEELIPTCILKCKGQRIPRKILKKNTVGGFVYPILRLTTFS